MRVVKSFTFEAAHYLPGYHGACAKMHGHSYKLEVGVEGPIGSDGMIMDFKCLKKLVDEAILRYLDHAVVNDLIPIPTAENMLTWIHEKVVFMQRHVLAEPVHVAYLRLWETETSYAEVTYDDQSSMAKMPVLRDNG